MFVVPFQGNVPKDGYTEKWPELCDPDKEPMLHMYHLIPVWTGAEVVFLVVYFLLCKDLKSKQCSALFP